ncbi:XK-related protein 8-like [Spinachia spinachia]
MRLFKFSRVDVLLISLGLLSLLLDIVLDVVAAVSFYQEQAYASLGILLLLLLGSSVLVQAFSWLWYSDDKFERTTKVESCLTEGQLKLLHVLQLGSYFRHAGVVEVSLCSPPEVTDPQGTAVYLIHDLNMLRLIETFSESAPQLVLMLAIMLKHGGLGPVTVLKALGSASTMAFSVTNYHRSLRSFLPDKEKQQMLSSVVYFLWNLLLISSRLTALALFASAWPCYILAHFLFSWVVLCCFAWRSKSDFMDSLWGERLYRATVGLIWYFDWFNVGKGRTRYRTLLYHGYMLVDISVLCGLWGWRMSTETPHSKVAVGVYILGLFFKMLYYKCCHPNVAKEELRGDHTEEALSSDETDFPVSSGSIQAPTGEDMDTVVMDRSGPSEPASVTKGCNKRMRKLAENFYS